MTVAVPMGELRVGITQEGLALSIERGSLRFGLERTWAGQTKAGLYYRAEF